MENERDRVSKALDSLTTGLFPFVEREMKAIYHDNWLEAAHSSFRDDRTFGDLKGNVVRWDTHALLTVMWDQWNRVFRHKLGQAERSLVSELRGFRNRWAHQAAFNFDDTYRLLDSAERLLNSVDAEEASFVERDKTDLLRAKFSREARAAYRKTLLMKQKWMDFSIYLICCASIDFVILQYFGLDAWFFALFVIFVFVYLAYQRLVVQAPIFYGPHECPACRKIIYGAKCPYCEPPPRNVPTQVATSAADKDG